MSNPTSNFGWQMPTPTDLVTSLPADFEVFGQAVDSTMADLKGGTSGQILSKNSNTDMDFVWIANQVGDITGVTAGTGISGGGTSGDVTITNSMATAIDAKGDLIAGTGADAFSRLAVGTNDFLLQAASGETTGLKWGGGWTSYTPVWGVVSGTAPTIGNGTLTGGYRRIGSQVDFWINHVGQSTTTWGSGTYTFSLPVAISSSEFNFGYNIVLLDAGVTWYNNYRGTGVSYGFTDKFIIVNPGVTAEVTNASPFAWNTGDGIKIFGSYRVVA